MGGSGIELGVRGDLSHGLQHLGGDSRGKHDHTARVIIHVVSSPAAPHPVRQQDADLIACEDAPYSCMSFPAHNTILKDPNDAP